MTSNRATSRAINEQDFLTRISAKNRQRRLDTDPCIEEGEISLNCQDETGDIEACHREIENYKQCKTFWHNVKRDREKKGIHPALPPPAEREQIKTQFLTRIKGDIKKLQEEKQKKS